MWESSMSQWNHGLSTQRDLSNTFWQTKLKMTSNSEQSYSVYMGAKHTASFEISCRPKKPATVHYRSFAKRWKIIFRQVSLYSDLREIVLEGKVLRSSSWSSEGCWSIASLEEHSTICYRINSFADQQ